jgi:histidyl-tRNA synthetase
MEKIGFSRFTIRVNNRLVLNGMLESLGLAGRTESVLRALDKLPKVGAEAVVAEMSATAGTSREQALRVLEFAGLTGMPNEILTKLEPLVAGNEQGTLGIAKLRELFATCRAAGIPEERLVLDVAIARGLDYYTGTIYETFLSDMPGIGSVCSGGRYDNLAGLFTNQPLPGVGASLGLDRLLDAMGDLGMISNVSTPARVLVTIFDESRLPDYMRIARVLRRNGIATELYPDAKKLGHQLKYASRKGFRIAVIAGEEEFAAGKWQVKDLESGSQASVAEASLADHVTGILKS